MKKNYRSIRLICGSALAGLVMAGMSSCGKKDANSPGVEFMPDMYRSPSMEYYGINVIGTDTLLEAMLPVKGSVARGFLPYAYANTPEGLAAATINLHNPLSAAKHALYEKEGEVLFGKFCVHCHGASGAGDGKVGGKLPGAPPAYSSIQGLTEGRIFHAMTYGKGLMGSHASQLTQEERWKLVLYVEKLIGPKAAPAAETDKAVAAVAVTPSEAK